MYNKHFDLQDIKSPMRKIKNDLHEAKRLLQKNERHLQELGGESRVIMMRDFLFNMFTITL